MHWNLNDFTILSEYFHLKQNYVLPLYQISTFLEWNLQLLFRCLFFFLFPHSKTWRCCEMGRLFGSLPAPFNSIYICRHHCQAALLLLEVEQNVERASVRAMTLFTDLTVNTGNKQEGEDLNPQPTLKIRRDLFVLGFTVWFFQWKLLMLTNHH